jgi:catechol 2,3-dioxygenase-like lactoylglutathione lyase family enzyme
MANASTRSFLTVHLSGEGVGNAGADESFAVTKGTDMRDYRDSKVMAKALREGLAGHGMTLPHSAALEIVARQFGLESWNILSAKIDEAQPASKGDAIGFQQVVPIMRIFDVAKAREFYLDFLGFSVDWEHRHGENYALYMQVSRSGLKLHLSEHAGDVTPGGHVRVHMTGIEVLHRELQAKDYRYMKPGLEDEGTRLELSVTDPFGNRIRFVEPRSR